MTVSPVSRQALRSKTRRVVALLEKTFGVPERGTSRRPPLDVLISTLLSQHTSDANSGRAYERLRERYPRWEEVAAARSSSIAAAIRPGGLARQKSLRIRKILRIVKDRYGSLDLTVLNRRSDDEVMKDLCSLDGVGAKTAACVLLFSLGRDVFPVDTHVHRTCSRLGLARGSRTPEETYDRMKGLVPRGKSYSFHLNLIRFGRSVCRSRFPLCGKCPLYAECLFPQKRARKQASGAALLSSRGAAVEDELRK